MNPTVHNTCQLLLAVFRFEFWEDFLVGMGPGIEGSAKRPVRRLEKPLLLMQAVLTPRAVLMNWGLRKHLGMIVAMSGLA